ncbi:uncharacterized protein J4E79_008000 [Alternaria viburni]|uniref:uncharacterized protein n=1 Tax=Alternaria viburni TaxID=566460 RepID=UPI0020C3BA8D|nr:uncharacterized protein J4E79_008000 [Alternaria viburni]KAI4656446.1 hypothetical protein J4E79_008000 [Alternaria viburni]
MPPKRKNTENAAAMDRPEKKTKAPKKGAKAAPEVYTAQQKAAIQQFISFTQLDKSTAVRALKSHGWDAQNAVNASRSMSLSSRTSHLRDVQPAQVHAVSTINTADDERLSSGKTAASSDSTKSSIETYTVQGAFRPHAVPHLVEGLDCLQTEQHRVQAEHLSRVLHSSLSLTNVTNAPESSEPTVSLRGGSGNYIGSGGYGNDYSEHDISGRRSPQASDTPGQAALWALGSHYLKCMAPMDYASYVDSCKQETIWFESIGITQIWPTIAQAIEHLPITVGVNYNTFIQSLSLANRSVFAKLFSLLPLINHKTIPAPAFEKWKLARLAFFHGLGRDGRTKFCRIIIERIKLVAGADEVPVLSDATSSPIDTVHLFVTAKLFVQLNPPISLKNYQYHVYLYDMPGLQVTHDELFVATANWQLIKYIDKD